MSEICFTALNSKASQIFLTKLSLQTRHLQQNSWHICGFEGTRAPKSRQSYKSCNYYCSVYLFYDAPALHIRLIDPHIFSSIWFDKKCRVAERLS